MTMNNNQEIFRQFASSLLPPLSSNPCSTRKGPSRRLPQHALPERQQAGHGKRLRCYFQIIASTKVLIMKTIDDLKLEYREKCAISEASKVLKEKFSVEKVVLFGSKAREDDDKESDIDLLVLTSRPVSWNERKAINNALYEIQMAYDVIISTLITTVTEWNEGTFSVLPVHEEISNQGIVA